MKHILGIIAVVFFASTQAHAGIFGPNWTVYNGIPYGPDPQEMADVYILKRGVNPAVVFIHGGGWSAGDKSGYAGYYAEKWAMAGYNVVSINYRLANVSVPATHWNAQLQDAQLAIRWIRHNASTLRIDPARIAVFGDSAGGHLALFLGSLNTSVPGDRSAMFSEQSPAANVVVDMFGPTNLTQPEMYNVLGQLPLFGGKTYAQAPALYWDASPVRVVTSRSAPTCIIQGTTDTVVSQNQSLELVGKLIQAGVPSKYISFNGGHWFVGLTPSSQKSKIDDAAVSFVNGYLRPNRWNAL